MSEQTIIEISDVKETADLAPATKETALIQPTGYGGFTNKDLAILRTTSFLECKNSMEELAVACNLAKKYDLDPFAKEIWAMKISGKLVIEASASGWRKIIRRQKNFKKMIIQPWFEGDDIGFDFMNGKVTHHTQNPNERGGKGKKASEANPYGAYCLVEYKDGSFNLAVTYWEEYVKTGNNTPWGKQKSEMIKNKASAIFGRTYCGVSGLYSQGEVQEEPKKTGEEKKDELRSARKKLSITTNLP